MLDVIIIGAGLSGLTAAYHLQSKGYKVAVFEANGKVGGRCKSDYIDGFILDRGLHFFQKGYSESKITFDYRTLRMEDIYPGVMLHYKNNFHLVTNPLKKLGDSVYLAFLPFMTLMDKVKLTSFLTFLLTNTEESFKKLKDVTTREFLESRGFSNLVIDSFFKPLHQAIFIDETLSTSAFVFASLMKNFCFEESSIPAYGIGSIAVQLEEKLEENTVRFRSRVKHIDETGVELHTGEYISAKKVIVSIPPNEIAKINGDTEYENTFKGVTCIYFATKTPPVKSPILLLNGNPTGIVNHVFVPTTIQPSYAPPGSHLVSVTLKKEDLREDDEIIDDVLNELIDWFGVKVNDWMHIKTYHIPFALPHSQALQDFKYFEEKDGVYYCGDYLSFGSVNNAVLSGKYVAEALDEELLQSKKPEKKKVFF